MTLEEERAAKAYPKDTDARIAYQEGYKQGGRDRSLQDILIVIASILGWLIGSLLW